MKKARIINPRQLYVFIFLFILLLSSCAIIEAPKGGKKDINPPSAKKYIPANKSTNFSAKKIKIEFDEFIRLKDVTTQIIISPPLANAPDVKEKGKSVLVKFNDSLEKNTTYNISFGKSISDITENNILMNFNYIFSTGNSIDSMIIRGQIIDAFSLTTEKDVTVLLYNQNEDSLPYKKIPQYVAKTDDKGIFLFNNIKQGRYKIFALKDINNNYLYDLPEEKIGFLDTLVSPFVNDTNKTTIKPSYNLIFFKEETGFQHIVKSSTPSYGKIMFVFYKPAGNIKLKLLKPQTDINFNYCEINKSRDTLFYWFKNLTTDSLTIEVSDNNIILDTVDFVMPSKTQKSRTGKGSVPAAAFGHESNLSSKMLDLNKPVKINFSQPIAEFDFSKITLTEGKDSAVIPKFSFSDTLKRKFEISYQWKENQSYKLFIPPNTFKDILDFKNDTIKSDFKTKSLKDYAKIILNITVPESGFQYILQLIDEKGNVIREDIISTSGKTTYDFLPPRKYDFRLMYDSNNNSKWSTGNYLKKLQPDKVLMYGAFDTKANWDTEMDWKIK
ncbi:MAG: Ig-like domain-containing protein [Bacteroidales bacterium]|nr:Ig-like domain-containing protein [Bacteroidales bacterium]